MSKYCKCHIFMFSVMFSCSEYCKCNIFMSKYCKCHIFMFSVMFSCSEYCKCNIFMFRLGGGGRQVNRHIMILQVFLFIGYFFSLLVTLKNNFFFMK